ncbi:MAG: DUF2807 domain-containing protein [Flavobacteriaceae bacterium]|nr:MAG: DUF2807 domain-containing protein [Flavobacteriaceae bacterium]
MKKIITLSIILLVSTCIQAQFFNKKIVGNGNEIQTTRTTSDYSGISVLGSFDVKLIKGTEGDLKIHIEENLLPYLITEVSKGKLKIRWKKNVNIRTKKGVLIVVPFQSIETVAMVGSGDIFSDETIEEDTFKISLSGSGDIVLNIDSELTKASISGSGDIKLQGRSNTLKCSVAGSGDFSGRDFKCENVSISIAGSGDASVFASKNLNASVAGSGDIDYYGNPKREDISVSGSGEITMR